MVEYLKKKGYNAWLNPEKNGDCDIYYQTPQRQFSLEVKTDFASLYTGNVCIEPQTLEHTKADFFAFLLPHLVIKSTADVRNLYNEYYPTGKDGGDQHKRLALVPKDIFIK